MRSMIVGDIRLGVACEVVFDDQDIFHDRFLFYTHHYFHGHVVNVYQVQWLCTKDGLQGGYLGVWLRKYGTLDSCGQSSSFSGPCLVTRTSP